jgi:hypothetical protein
MQFTFPFSRKNKNKKSRAARTRSRRRPAFETLEDRCLLTSFPMGVPVGSDPPPPSVFYTGASVSAPFQKTITFTNNSPAVGGKTVYAFIEGENTRQAIAPYEGTSGFDPYDPNNHEYRGYLGFTDGSGNYFAGVAPQTSITFTVPLVFWDSGRIHFSTDGNQFTSFNSASPPGAPFNYLDTNTQAIFFGNIESATPTQLDFTPIYNSFDSNGMPVTTDWKSPVTSGLFKNGQQLLVTGAGLPAAGATVTVDSSHPNYVTLPVTASPTPQKAQQYTFTAKLGESISPTDRYIQKGFNLATTGGSTTQNGVVMWYHALVGVQPNNDAPDQLFESSFKGKFLDPTQNPGTGFQFLVGADVLAGAKNDSADYDLSFVDSINLPIALEATNTLIPDTTPTNQAPFGWVGSDQTVADFQTALQDFNSGKLTGSYFPDGKGWPSYLTTVDPGNLKLPAGQNLFLASPAVPPGTLKSGAVSDIHYFKMFDDMSVIDSPLYALTTGGDGPSTLIMGSQPEHTSTGNFLGLRTITDADKASLKDFILPNTEKGFKYIVTYVQNGDTKTAGIVKGPWMQNGELVGVELYGTAPTDQTVYTFAQSKQDYAAGKIAGLWYSWAKYYAEHVTSTEMPNVDGTITNGNILTLKQAAPKDTLVPGMAVTGTVQGQVPSGCVVLSISSDRKTIELSTTATGTSFNFAKPAFDALVGYDSQHPLDTPLVNNMSFDAAHQAFALAFSETVYTVMSAWGASVQKGDPNVWVPLMGNIVGGNLGTNFLPHVNTDVANTLTVLSKSALRGVPDYTSSLYSDPAQWYPDPALPAGGQTFNVFNLLPYVWFVHEKLGLTAYAFALDDDIGNVLGGGANHVDMSVGGLDGLPNSVFPNRDPYTNVSQWGVVSTVASDTQTRSSEIGGLTNTDAVHQIQPFDYNHNVAGVVINGPGVPTGTYVQFTNIAQNPTMTTLDLSNPLTTSATNPTFTFFGPLTFTGTVLGTGQAGDTIYLTSEDAYNTLLKLGPLQNIKVAGEGIDPTKTVTIKQVFKDAGHFVVQLSPTDALDGKLVSQKGAFYAYTFGTSVIPVIRDPGFEWRSVQGPGFNHGQQLTTITPDWTFTDSLTNPSTLFAGIAFDNTSTYTNMNPPAPQGLQVGFVQGDSSITQKLTLGAGKYNLTLSAAQRAGQQTSQSLDVMLDDTKVGTINPADTTYKLTTIPFTVETPGKHTITFKGTQAGDSTVLLDAIQASPVSAQALVNQSPGAPSIGAGSPTQVAQDPYALFVQKLYHNVLKRPPSAAGLKRWTSFLRSGGLRRAVAVALVTKPEYLEAHPDATSFVKGLYHDVLYRLPRPQRLATWLEFAQAHPDDWVALAVAIMNQPEAIMRLRELFQQANPS